jgi:hypothetical protein
MTLDNERELLVTDIEAAFTDGMSGKERAKFLRELTLADNRYHESYELEYIFRDRVWQAVSFEGHEADWAPVLSDEALAYYLPAFMVAAVNDPLWLINNPDLEQRMIGLFGRFPADRLDVLIAFVDYMVRTYSRLIGQQDELIDEELPLLDVDDFELRLLMYLDEKKALLARREERREL